MIVVIALMTLSIGHFLEISHPAPLLPMNGHFWIQKLPEKKVRGYEYRIIENVYLFVKYFNRISNATTIKNITYFQLPYQRIL